MAALTLDVYVDKIVAQAPPLSQDVLDRLAVLLSRPTAGGGR